MAEPAAALFYSRLFEIAPHVKPLFKGDMEEQGRKLMQMIGVAVKGLDHLETIAPAIREMGRRHAAYGVTAAHYEPVAEALLWTLEKGLGESFTREVKEAWTAVYLKLASVMQAGAAEAAAGA